MSDLSPRLNRDWLQCGMSKPISDFGFQLVYYCMEFITILAHMIYLSYCYTVINSKKNVRRKMIMEILLKYSQQRLLVIPIFMRN